MRMSLLALLPSWEEPQQTAHLEIIRRWQAGYYEDVGSGMLIPKALKPDLTGIFWVLFRKANCSLNSV